MHHYLETTENAASELFSAYEVARGQWGGYALHEGQWKYISNGHRKSLDNEGMNDSVHEQIIEKIDRAENLSEQYKKEAEIYDVTQRILAGAILQLAKQGLSTVFGESKNYPQEPKIGGIPVAKIILEGRNQSMHYEEGKYRNGVTSCFQALEQIDSKFSLQESPRKNMSKEILEILDWYDYESYIATMEGLLNR